MRLILFSFRCSRGMKFENVSVLLESILDVIKDVRHCWYVYYFLCITSSLIKKKSTQRLTFSRLPRKRAPQKDGKESQRDISKLFCPSKRIHVLHNLDKNGDMRCLVIVILFVIVIVTVFVLFVFVLATMFVSVTVIAKRKIAVVISNSHHTPVPGGE